MSSNIPSEVCDSRFKLLLQQFDPETLGKNPGVVFGLWADLTLAYMNPAWFRFARANKGEPAISHNWKIGAAVMNAVTPPLKPFYITAYTRCLQDRKPWQHLYECSSADIFRQFYMTAYPLQNSRGLLVVNSLVAESDHDNKTRPPQEPLEELYRDANNLITQCAHCRRIRRVDNPDQWDWVPFWIENPPQMVSHGLCSPCFNYYYPEA